MKYKSSEHFLSGDQMLHLVELGLDVSDAEFMWFWWDGYEDEMEIQEAGMFGQGGCGIMTYSLNDLMKKLVVSKDAYHIRKVNISPCSEGYVSELIEDVGGYETRLATSGKSDTIIDSLYELLCWCIKNKGPYDKYLRQNN